jgi:hypothetical protein
MRAGAEASIPRAISAKAKASTTPLIVGSQLGKRQCDDTLVLAPQQPLACSSPTSGCLAAKDGARWW